jgi:hypothetical protein
MTGMQNVLGVDQIMMKLGTDMLIFISRITDPAHGGHPLGHVSARGSLQADGHDCIGWHLLS